MEDDQKEILGLPEPRGLEKVREHVPTHLSYGGYGIGGDAGEEENHFRSYLRAVRKHLWLIIGITLIVTSLVTISVARKPDIFSAEARVQVDLENNPGAGAGGKNGTVVINSQTSDPTYFNTQLQILVSPGLMRRVVRTLDLEHNPDFFKGAQRQSTWQTLRRMVGLGSKQQETPKRSINDRVESQPDEPVRFA